MHGDKEVSTKELARVIGTKSITPCRPEIAQKHSGYKVGGTSPFGTRKALPIYMGKDYSRFTGNLYQCRQQGTAGPDGSCGDSKNTKPGYG